MGFTEIKYASPLSLLLVFPSSLLSWLPTAFSLLPPPHVSFPQVSFITSLSLSHPPTRSLYHSCSPVLSRLPARLFPCSSSLSIHRSLNNSLINRLIISNCSRLLFLSLQPCPCQSLSQSPSLTNVINLINSRKNANFFFFAFFSHSLSLFTSIASSSPSVSHFRPPSFPRFLVFLLVSQQLQSLCAHVLIPLCHNRSIMGRLIY